MACPHVSGGAALILGADNSKSPQKVISDLLNDSVRNAISGLRSGDTNALLYVGGNGSPPSPSIVWRLRTSEGLRCEPVVHEHRLRRVVPGARCKLPCADVHTCLRSGRCACGSRVARKLTRRSRL